MHIDKINVESNKLLNIELDIPIGTKVWMMYQNKPISGYVYGCDIKMDVYFNEVDYLHPSIQRMPFINKLKRWIKKNKPEYSYNIQYRFEPHLNLGVVGSFYKVGNNFYATGDRRVYLSLEELINDLPLKN